MNLATSPVAPADTRAAERLALREPRTPEETGIDFGLILDLCLRTIYHAGRPSARQICRRLALAFSVIEEVLIFLRKQELVEIVGSAARSETEYEYALTSKGMAKTGEAIERSEYVGPAPVPFDEYVRVTNLQAVREEAVSHTGVAAALSHLVLEPGTVKRIGTAVASGKSIFLYGDPGNGKSTIAESIGAMLPGRVYIPYAIEVYGQIIRIFDPRVHLLDQAPPLADEDAEFIDALRGDRDRRWVLSHRPVVIAGGELTLDELELRYSPTSKFYIAPLQMKANNGVLVLDDFGRQRVRAVELLNRWMVPMERRVDHLSLHTGDTIEVPFELLLVFATNITPSRLGDEAFFRRIRHKIRIQDPTEAEFRAIIDQVARRSAVSLDETAVDEMIEDVYRTPGRPFRGVHPRDIVELIVDLSRYEGSAPAFSRETVEQACASYFVQD